MKSFKDNLTKFLNQNNMTRAEILELSELTEDELQAIEGSDLPCPELYEFCVNTGLDFQSIFSDSGFVSKSIRDQYSEYPSHLRSIITNVLFKRLKKRCPSLGDNLKETMKGRDITVSKLLTRNAILGPYDIDAVKTAVSDTFSDKEFDLIFASTAYSMIVNQNYDCARIAFCLNYSQIARAVGSSTSGVSNWGGLIPVPIPSHFWKEFAHIFGKIDPRKFTTKILDVNYFKCRTLSVKVTNGLSDKLIDPPSEKELSKTGETKVNLSEPVRYTPKATNGSKARSHNDDSVNNTDKFKVVHKIAITEEMTAKMFLKLNPENKSKVNQLIADLFFSQL